MNDELNVETINTKPRVLSASWTVETAQDLNTAHGMSYPRGKWYNPKVFYQRLIYLFCKHILRHNFVEEEILEILSKEIAAETNKIVLEQILKDYGNNNERSNNYRKSSSYH